MDGLPQGIKRRVWRVELMRQLVPGQPPVHHVVMVHEVRALPRVELRMMFTPRGGRLMRDAGHLMIDLREILEGRSPGASAALNHLSGVWFETPDGFLRDGWGAAVGPTGEAPTMTLLVSNDDVPVAVAVRSTLDWVRRFGGGELPDMGQATDLEEERD